MTPALWSGAGGVPDPIDLSHPVSQGHFRWSTRLHRSESLQEGGLFNSSQLSMPAHAFTHVDAALHVDDAGRALHELDLRTWVGVARVVDLTEVKPREPITAAHLEHCAERTRPDEIVLLRTDWDSRRSVQDAAFWNDAPWMSRDAAEWLRDREVRAVGFDFPQDEPIRHAVAGDKPPRADFVTHEVLLKRGIGLIEYLRGLDRLPELVLLCAAPLALVHGDGAPCRAIALPLLESTADSASPEERQT